MKNHNDIGVIGNGFVGSQVIKWFKGCSWYSKTGGSFEAVNKKKFIFLCLPTPYNKYSGFNITILIENIRKLNPGKNIIVKSTVLPNTTKILQKEFRQHKLFFNPEFLREKTAWKDFSQPDRQIVGITDKKDLPIAEEIIIKLPFSDFNTICDSSEAEMAKLIGNCYLASRVVFANQVYDYCKLAGVNYTEMINIVRADPRIGTSHWDIKHNGFRGYAGHCFPKDMQAVIWDTNNPLLKKIDSINKKLLPKKVKKEFYE